MRHVITNLCLGPQPVDAVVARVGEEQRAWQRGNVVARQGGRARLPPRPSNCRRASGRRREAQRRAVARVARHAPRRAELRRAVDEHARAAAVLTRWSRARAGASATHVFVLSLCSIAGCGRRPVDVIVTTTAG